MAGDLNIHHARWLRFSNGNSRQGADLKILCDNLGLQQMTKEPTRQQYLLDLSLTDIPGTKVKVGCYIADHKFQVAHLPMPEIESKTIIRYGFKMDDANWKDLKRDLKNMDWDELKNGTAEDALDFFMDHLWLLLCTHIPYQEIVFHKKSHPWLNAKCKEAIEKKNAAEDSP